MSNFHFLRPEWFVALIPLLIVFWALRHHQLQNKNWQAFCDKKLLPYLFDNEQLRQHKRPLFLVLLAGILVIFALAGPSWQKRPQPVFKKQSALVIALDLSRSMDATDIKPSRLRRAVHKIEDILDRRKEGQTALVVYASDAFTVTPLTDDTETISSQLKSLSTDIMPGHGSRPDRAISLAYDLFKQTSYQRGHIILVTDGIGKKELKLIDKNKTPAYTISVFGIGTAEGAPIPVATGGFYKDHNGTIVIPKMKPQGLRQLALENNGSFTGLTTGDSDINVLLSPLSSAFDTNSKATKLNTDTWVEAGPWLLLLVLPIAAFAFRKGYLLFFMLGILHFPEPGYAFEYSSLWKNNNQQAQQLMQSNQPDEAAKLFTDKKWQAAAEYKAGNYQQALEAYQQLDLNNPENLYNLANTQAQLGQYDKALENYNKVIEKNPRHTDAKYNRDQIEKMRQQQQQQQQSDQNADSDTKDNKPKDNKKEQSQQNNASDKPQSQQQQSAQQDTDKNAQHNSDSQQDKDKHEQQQKQTNMSEQDQNKPDEQKAKTLEQQMESEQEQEQQQANEQWLRRIPDDPGGLLRRKFKYQTQQHPQQDNGDQQW